MARLPPLRIRLKLHSDMSASLTCTRADGTTTWQRQSGQLGMVFPPHDLTHFAVETVLHYSDAFYGLIADGWEIADFAVPFPRGEPTSNARQVELMVGCFDSERRNFLEWNIEEFNAHAAVYASSTRTANTVSPRLLTHSELHDVRTLRADLLQRWSALRPGEAIGLDFLR